MHNCNKIRVQRNYNSHTHTHTHSCLRPPSHQSSWPLNLHNGLYCAAAAPPRPGRPGSHRPPALNIFSFPQALLRSLPISLPAAAATRSTAIVQRETFKVVQLCVCVAAASGGLLCVCRLLLQRTRLSSPGCRRLL